MCFCHLVRPLYLSTGFSFIPSPIRSYTDLVIRWSCRKNRLLLFSSSPMYKVLFEVIASQTVSLFQFFFFLAGSYLLTQQYISHGCKRASLVYEIKQVYFVLISTFILLFMVDIFIRRILFIELKFYLYLLELLVSSNINDDNVTFLIHNIYLNLGYCRIFYKILNTVIGHTV